MGSFLQLVARAADFVHFSRKRGLRIVLDVGTRRGICSGVSASYMLVQLNTRLSIVESAGIFHATCLWNPLTQNMGRRVPYSGLGFWRIGIGLGQKNTLKWSRSWRSRKNQEKAIEYPPLLLKRMF